MILTSFYSCVIFFRVGCVQGCLLLPDGHMQCPSCPLCLAKDILPFSLGLIIPTYLFACLLVCISEWIENKLNKSKKRIKR